MTRHKKIVYRKERKAVRSPMTDFHAKCLNVDASFYMRCLEVSWPFLYAEHSAIITSGYM